MKVSNKDKLVSLFKSKQINHAFIYGKNFGEINEAISDIKLELLANKESVDFETGSEFEEKIERMYSSIDILNSAKLIIIGNINYNHKLSLKLSAILNKKASNANIILVSFSEYIDYSFKSFFEKSKHNALLPCYPDLEKKSIQIIMSEIQKYNLNLNKDETALLIKKLVQQDRAIIKSEINKLYILSQISNINIGTIDQCLSSDSLSNYKIFEIFDFITDKKKLIKSINTKLNQIGSPIQMINLMISYCKKIISAKKMIEIEKLNKVQASSKLSIHFTYRERFEKQVQNLTLDQITSYLHMLIEMEINCKMNIKISKAIMINAVYNFIQ